MTDPASPILMYSGFKVQIFFNFPGSDCAGEIFSKKDDGGDDEGTRRKGKKRRPVIGRGKGEEIHVLGPGPENEIILQGNPSGRGTLFAVIKIKVLPQYKFLLLKWNSYFNVNKRLSSTRWTIPYTLFGRSLRGDTYMTSANFSDFGPPPPLSRTEIS